MSKPIRESGFFDKRLFRGMSRRNRRRVKRGARQLYNAFTNVPELMALMQWLHP